MASVSRRSRGPRSNIKQLSSELKTLAMERGAGAKLPTVVELCAMLGTHATALDSALEQLETLNIISRRQGSGIYVSLRIHRKSIMVLLKSTFFLAGEVSPFWGMLWALFAKEAEYRATFKDEDFLFHLVTPQASEASPLPEPIMKDIESGKVDGMLLIGMNRVLSDWLESRGIPMVTFAGPGKRIVELGMPEACRAGVDSLVDDGCRTIGLWRHRWAESLDEKLDELERLPPGRFLDALEKRGLAFDPALSVGGYVGPSDLSPPLPSYQEQGYEAALRLFGDPSGPKPDGLVIEDDMVADGAIAGLETLGLRVGVDVKIAVYTNLGSPILFSHRDKLTRVEFDPNEIPAAMLRLLHDEMAGEDASQHKIVIEPVVRRRNLS